MFGELPEAKVRGWKPGRFSFNVPVSSGGGRCEACEGDGTLRIEMNFLPDVYVPCERCEGRRYSDDTLEVRFKGHSIADVLEMTVEDARGVFAAQPAIKRVLDVLWDVGLGYVKLGQSATQLSGGEAQRVKLASELCRRQTGRTVYLLDEPTTGLHFADVAKLVEVLGRLVDAGNTVIVIEHNIDVARVSDWLIELGPEGGSGGGMIVAEGSPEELAGTQSATAEFILDSIERHGRAKPAEAGAARPKPGPAKKKAAKKAPAKKVAKKAPVKKTPAKTAQAKKPTKRPASGGKATA
jgi:excinuclease ABC subunit A